MIILIFSLTLFHFSILLICRRLFLNLIILGAKSRSHLRIRKGLKLRYKWSYLWVLWICRNDCTFCSLRKICASSFSHLGTTDHLSFFPSRPWKKRILFIVVINLFNPVQFSFFFLTDHFSVNWWCGIITETIVSMICRGIYVISYIYFLLFFVNTQLQVSNNKL